MKIQESDAVSTQSEFGWCGPIEAVSTRQLGPCN